MKKNIEPGNMDAAADIFSSFDYADLMIRFGVNIVAIFIMIRLIYYPIHKNKDFLFTFSLFNILNFLFCILLVGTKMKSGFAFGLFAIFSLMRYRTVTVPIKEMGYLFACLLLGILNALALSDNNYYILIAVNLFILALALLLDRMLSLTHENVKEIVYERIDLIHPEKRAEMTKDIIQRTGLPIHRIEIKNINFLRDVAYVNAFYYAKSNESQMAMTGDDD